MDHGPSGRTPEVTGSPLVLLINDEEWTARSIDTVLKSKGYAVLLAYTGQQGLDLASKVQPDIVLIDYKLPDMTGDDLCARIGEMPTIRPSTPLLVVSGRSLERGTRLRCLESGAWDVLRLPFDPDEFLFRMGTYLSAKRDADDAREESHLDPLTGFYNVRGLTKRAAEVAADAVRHNRPVACVALGTRAAVRRTASVEEGRSGSGVEMASGAKGGGSGPDADAGADAGPGAGGSRGAGGPSDGDGSLEADGSLHAEGRVGTDGELEADAKLDADVIARTLSLVTRVSDIVARVGDNDFVIIAPSTDETGIQRLAARVFESLETSASELDPGRRRAITLRAGYHAIKQPLQESVLPEDLLTRATAALRKAQVEDEREAWIRAFDPSEAN